MKALFDSNIIIDALKAIPLAFAELERYEDCLISRITWIEILVGADSRRKRKRSAIICPCRTCCNEYQEHLT